LDLTVGLVKKLIVKERSIDLGNNPKLLYNGHIMDDKTTLAEYNLEKNTRIDLLIAASGISEEERIRIIKEETEKKIREDSVNLKGKPCPGCQKMITKFWKHGSHTIKCPHCSKQWCYVCSGDYGKCECKKACHKTNPKNCGCPVCNVPDCKKCKEEKDA